VQKQYIPYMSKDDQEMAIEMMNWAIWIFRENNLPVIRIYHTDPEWGPEPGSAAFEFHDSLKVKETDPKIVKTYPSAFTKTELDKLLQEKNINTLFLCGLSSVGCVLATYLDAKSYDYKAFMIKDALISHKANYTDSIEEIFNALDLETVEFMVSMTKE
ncbi:MAG: cysteine hydrolase, partial [Bacteroidales bacterium]|nr:cysteine hydrolase [Bacteroidales bacterium]